MIIPAKRNHFTSRCGMRNYNRVVTGAESPVKLMAVLYRRGKDPAIVSLAARCVSMLMKIIAGQIIKR